MTKTFHLLIKKVKYPACSIILRGDSTENLTYLKNYFNVNRQKQFYNLSIFDDATRYCDIHCVMEVSQQGELFNP